jgi:hypothetical protein
MYRQRLPADLDMSKLAMRPVPSAMDVFLEPPLESSDGSNNGDNAAAVVAGNEQSSRPSTSRSIHTPAQWWAHECVSSLLGTVQPVE